MVFNLSSKKKKSSKIPKLTSKVRVQASSQRNVTVTNNLIMTPMHSQNPPDPSLYNKLSSSRAIFESNKLESACSFLRSLKEKLENDIKEPKIKLDKQASEVITDILDTLIDVSDNITPIVSDVSDSTKSLYRNSTLDSSSISEKQFNKTMAATNKLLELSKKSGMPATTTDGGYYFAQKIIATNLEELTIFKNSMQSIGDKIYVDKKLLKQLIHLHSLLKDTIVKLKSQEEKFENSNNAKVYFTAENPVDSTKMTESPSSPTNPAAEQLNDSTKTGQDSIKMTTAMDTLSPSKEYHTAINDSTKTPSPESYYTANPLNDSTKTNPFETAENFGDSTKTNPFETAENFGDSTKTNPFETAENFGDSTRTNPFETADNFDDSTRVSTVLPPPLATSTPKSKSKKKSKKSKSKSSLSPEPPEETFKTLPHETQNVSGVSVVKKDSLLMANKMKKKERRASKGSIDNASLLGVEIPQKGVDYYKSDAETPEKVKSDTPTEISIIKKPEIPEETVPVLPETPEKTFISRSTETSDSAFPISRRKSLHKGTSGGRDAQTCCNNTKDMANQTVRTPSKLMIENHSTPMVSDKTHRPGNLKSVLNQTDSQEKGTGSVKFGKPCIPRGALCEAIGSLKGKIVCKECSARKTLFNPGESDLERSMEGSVSDKTYSTVPRQPSVNFQDDFSTVNTKGISSISKSYTYGTSKQFNISVPGYFEGLNKWIAELECMRNCLRQAAVSGTDVHECIKIFPKDEEDYCESECPHFHTTMDGVPMVIQINKDAIPIDGTLKCCRKQSRETLSGKSQTCCQETVPDSPAKQSRSSRIWGTISKTAQERGPINWVPSKWKKSILRSANQNKSSPVQSPDKEAKKSEMGDYTISYNDNSGKSKLSYDMDTIREDYYVQKTEYTLNEMSTKLIEDVNSSASMPYIAATTSLPKIDDPNKICSSLKFDVKTVPVTFENSVLYHPDEKVNKALKNIKVEELLDSFRPAKCCRKTVLNEKPRGTMPYAASLQSLPLIESDVQTIYRTMQSNVQALYPKQTLFEYYINFQKNYNKDYTPRLPGRVFQVYFFELFKKDDEEKSKEPNSSRSSSTNTLHDLKILDFIKKIYTSDPISEKMSKKYPTRPRCRADKTEKQNGESKERKEKPRGKNREKKEHAHRKHHNKYKKSESKTYYTSVESYTTSKTNFFLNSSSSSLISGKYTTKSRNSNSMYSFLLIPKSELNLCASNYDLSTSYAPSVNSLPFEDDLEAVSNVSNCTQNVLNRPSSEESDDWFLSPGNYAKTLDGIYELDEHGNMRQKGSAAKQNTNANAIPSDIVPALESRCDLPDNARNLSTIYEADEKSTAKDSSASIFCKSSSKSRSFNRSKSLSPKSSVSRRSCTTEPSRIPVSIQTHSNSALGKDRVGSSLQFPKMSNISSRSSLCSNKSEIIKPTRTSKVDLSSKPSYVQTYKPSLHSDISCSKRAKIQSVDTATSMKDMHKDFTAKVHPKVTVRQNIPRASTSKIKQGVELQRALDGTDNFELPITFDIVKPGRNRNYNVSLEKNVMSFDIESLNSTLNDSRRDLECYRSENMYFWPQLQKKFEAPNKAFYVSVHRSPHDRFEINSPSNPMSRIQVLQQHPSSRSNSFVMNNLNSKDRLSRLTTEIFPVGYVGEEQESKSILKKPSSSSTKDKSHVKKKRVKHIHPEVIDIKVSKNIKSTRLKHRFFKNGDRPGYVTVLSTPCNCPDITIFLPCCCGQNDCCNVSTNTFVREAQQYAMVPITEKEQKKK